MHCSHAAMGPCSYTFQRNLLNAVFLHLHYNNVFIILIRSVLQNVSGTFIFWHFTIIVAEQHNFYAAAVQAPAPTVVEQFMRVRHWLRPKCIPFKNFYVTKNFVYECLT
jgi:hypothetical protein